MNTDIKITQEEWKELFSLKELINDNPAVLHSSELEKFTELYVKTLPRKDYV